MWMNRMQMILSNDNAINHSHQKFTDIVYFFPAPSNTDSILIFLFLLWVVF